MTYLINNNGEVWSGSPIDDIQHPSNIVDLWTDEELLAIGLTRVVTPSPTLEEILATARLSMTLSFAQLLIGLVTEAWITEDEGDAWADGVLPTAVTSLIATLPQDQQFAARTRAKKATEILRLDPLVELLGLAQGKTAEELDQFFINYANV